MTSALFLSFWNSKSNKRSQTSKRISNRNFWTKITNWETNFRSFNMKTSGWLLNASKQIKKQTMKHMSDSWAHSFAKSWWERRESYAQSLICMKNFLTNWQPRTKSLSRGSSIANGKTIKCWEALVKQRLAHEVSVIHLFKKTYLLLVSHPIQTSSGNRITTITINWSRTGAISLQYSHTDSQHPFRCQQLAAIWSCPDSTSKFFKIAHSLSCHRAILKHTLRRLSNKMSFFKDQKQQLAFTSRAKTHWQNDNFNSKSEIPIKRAHFNRNLKRIDTKSTVIHQKWFTSIHL